MASPQEKNHAQLALPVLGMTCSACQIHVEKALNAAPSVEAATVNLMTHTAHITYDSGSITPEDLVAIIRNSGYEASVPRSGGASDTEEREQDNASQLKTKAIGTISAGMLCMLLSMPEMQTHSAVDHWLMKVFPFLWQIPHQALSISLFALTAAGMLWAGGPIYGSAWRAFRHGSSNMNSLVTLGTGSAFLYSSVATFFPEIFLHHGLAPQIYFESVLLILGFLLLGRWLEDRAKHKTLGALKAFASLLPNRAHVIRGGEAIDLPISEIQKGDPVAVRPGERIPVDGIITEGRTSIDESLITGESTPVERSVGDAVIGGSLNYDGAFVCKAQTIGAEGTLAQMMKLMEEAQSSKAPMQKLADSISSIFVPSILVLSVLTFLLWYALSPTHSFSLAFACAIAILVIACPCAMGLATPAAITVAVGRGAQMGVLFKGGESIERLSRVDSVLFDKTGTLTKGRPQVLSIHAVEGNSETKVLELAASVESHSEHPLATAIVERAKLLQLSAAATPNLQVLPGRGIQAQIGEEEVHVGNRKLLEEYGIAGPDDLQRVSPSSTEVFVAKGGKLIGWIELRDEIRSESFSAVKALKEERITTVMLTGDNQASAQEVASAVQIDQVHWSMLPEQKLDHIRHLQAKGQKVAMVGDGINDAAALAQADAGIAMGTGTDLAQEAGDVVLLGGNPLNIPGAIQLARQTVRVMKQNLWWALLYNVIGIPIAAGVLYPKFHVLLNPALASAAMALSSISVLANSLRLRRFQTQ